MKASMKALTQALAARLTKGALPGELDGFGPEEQAAAAAFLAATAATRKPGTVGIALEPLTGDGAPRRMRLAIVNDDMPFLVDSIAGAIGAEDIAIHRIIHPVVPVTRDADGRLTGVDEAGAGESMIYIETERADARVRRELVANLERDLADVRVAVADWRAMQAALASDAGMLEDNGDDAEGASLMRWFLDRHFTLLGHERWRAGGGTEGEPLGIARNPHEPPILAERSRQLALEYFRKGARAPLLVKSSLISPVHRRVPIDLVVVPVRSGAQITGLSIHAGLWTSAALNAPPRSVPVLRQRLAEMEAKLGFDRAGHAGKALAHAMATLPHDLITAVDAASVETLALGRGRNWCWCDPRWGDTCSPSPGCRATNSPPRAAWRSVKCLRRRRTARSSTGRSRWRTAPSRCCATRSTCGPVARCRTRRRSIVGWSVWCAAGRPPSKPR